MKARFYEAAQLELEEAVSWYEHELPGLGSRFREEVRSALTRVKVFPQAYPVLSQHTRRCLVSGFPYGIVYRYKNDEILVVTVAHLHRRPEYWVSRD